MNTELVKYGHEIGEKVKASPSEIKENVQGTNSNAKETGTQIYGLEQKEEINIQLQQNEETRIQKNEERLRNLWDHLKCTNIQTIGLPTSHLLPSDVPPQVSLKQVLSCLPEPGKP